jgi:hypothetical protein
VRDSLAGGADNRPMESTRDWKTRSAAWLDRDHALLTDDAGWSPVVQRDDLQLWRRRMPDDRNHLFRWRLPVVAAPADVVFEGFVHRLLDYHKAWTREFMGGRVVETLGPTARVVYQQFDPGVRVVTKRDLCSLEVVRDVGPGVQLASFRSVDTVAPVRGFQRITWWGAALCTALPGGTTSELRYLDREAQGGWLTSWMMNPAMKKYLVLQAEQVARFFADGGPPELRTKTG